MIKVWEVSWREPCGEFLVCGRVLGLIETLHHVIREQLSTGQVAWENVRIGPEGVREC